MKLPSNPAAIFLSTISGDARWAVPFRSDRTQQAVFHVSAEEAIPVVMMDQRGWFRYRDYGSFHVLELPFQGSSFLMVIVLPKAVDGLGAIIENELTAEKYGSWLTELSPTYTLVRLPKLKHADEIDLKPALQKMGMTSAFQPGAADFSEMSDAPGLHISAVVQKTFIQLDGDGTQANAATTLGTDVRTTIATAPAIVFNAAHPFFFELREVNTGASLFMGSIVRPRFDPDWIGAILPPNQGDKADKLGE